MILRRISLNKRYEKIININVPHCWILVKCMNVCFLSILYFRSWSRVCARRWFPSWWPRTYLCCSACCQTCSLGSSTCEEKWLLWGRSWRRSAQRCISPMEMVMMWAACGWRRYAFGWTLRCIFRASRCSIIKPCYSLQRLMSAVGWASNSAMFRWLFWHFVYQTPPGASAVPDHPDQPWFNDGGSLR